MNGYAPELIAVNIRFDNPQFRIKAATELPLSMQGERAKKALRAKYQRMIQNYFFDIVLHIADNHQQGEYMQHIFEPGISFIEVLELLEKCNSSAFQMNGTKSYCKSNEIFLPHRNDFSTKNRPAPDEWISKKQFWKFMWIIISNFPLFLCIEWN